MAELYGHKLFGDSSLKAYYRLEDANDSGPNGYTLTNNGSIPFNMAKFRNGGDLGASNSTDYFNRNTAIISPLADYTISILVKLQTEIGSGIYEFIRIENNTDKHVIYCQYQYNGGTRRIHYQQDRWVIAGYGPDYNVTLGIADWYHLVFRINSASMQIYVNGIAAGSPVTMDSYVAGSTATNNQLLIGAGNTVGTSTIINYSSIIVDDVAIFSRALTVAEIYSLYVSQVKKFENKLRPAIFTPGIAR